LFLPESLDLLELLGPTWKAESVLSVPLSHVSVPGKLASEFLLKVGGGLDESSSDLVGSILTSDSGSSGVLSFAFDAFVTEEVSLVGILVDSSAGKFSLAFDIFPDESDFSPDFEDENLLSDAFSFDWVSLSEDSFNKVNSGVALPDLVLRVTGEDG